MYRMLPLALWMSLALANAATPVLAKDPPTDAEIEKAVATILDPAAGKSDVQVAYKTIFDAGYRSRKWTDRFADALLEKNPIVRYRLDKALIRLPVPSDKAVPKLCAFLQKRAVEKQATDYLEDAIHRDVTRMLGNLGPAAPPEVVQTLIRVLRAPGGLTSTRYGAMEALGRIGLPAREAIPIISDDKFIPEDLVTQRVLRRIRLGVELDIRGDRPVPAKTVSALIDRCSGSDVDNRGAALCVLAERLPLMSEADRVRSIQAVLEGVSAGSGSDGDFATGALLRDRESAIPGLTKALEHDVPLVRKAAAQLLGHSGLVAKSSVPNLLKRFLEDEFHAARQACAIALSKIDPEDKRVVEGLKEAVNDTRLRVPALYALAKGSPEASVDVLAEYCGSPQHLHYHFSPMSLVIRRALVRVGKPAVIPLLRTLSGKDLATQTERFV